MRVALILLFGLILSSMVGVTIYASLDRHVLDAGPQLKASPWFQATLLDAYCGFLTFYCWVAYREASWKGRVGWFVAIMLTGNMAVSVYMLLRLCKWDTSRGPAGLLLRA